MKFLKYLVYLVPLVVVMAEYRGGEPRDSTDFMLIPLKHLAYSINKFTFRLFDHIPVRFRRNVCFSSFSIMKELSHLYFGSGGATEKELEKTLQYQQHTLDQNATARLWIISEGLLTSANTKYNLFSTTSTVLINERANLIPESRYDIIDSWVPLTVMNFEKQPKEAALFINRWICPHADENSYRIIEEINPNWDLVALDVTTFKGIWKNRFSRRNTREGEFYNKGLEINKVKIPMMRLTSRLEYYSDEKVRMVKLPLTGEFNFSMIVLLPRSLRGYETQKDEFEDYFQRAANGMTVRLVTVTLPKFNFYYSLNLPWSLCKMGVETLCTPEQFDLSRMLGKEKVTVGNVRHETLIEVSEYGINVGTRKTKDRYKAVEEPNRRNLKATHPFLFSIFEDLSKMTLLFGSVCKL